MLLSEREFIKCEGLAAEVDVVSIQCREWRLSASLEDEAEWERGIAMSSHQTPTPTWLRFSDEDGRD